MESKKREILDQLLIEFQPTIRIIALKINKNCFHYNDLDDLIVAGQMGLLDAYEKFDKNKSSFKTYAKIRIRGAMLDELRKLDWVPRNLREEIDPQIIYEIREEIPDLNDPERNAMKHLFQGDLNQLFKSLSREDRLLLDLRYMQDLKFYQIGKIFGLTARGIHLRLEIIVEKLKEEIRIQWKNEDLTEYAKMIFDFNLL